MQQPQTRLSCKQYCRLLRRKGHSIGEIARVVKRSESTVHWHVRDIQLTAEQQVKLRDRWRAVMVRVNAKRRGKPLKVLEFRMPPWSKELVQLIAHLSFDGRIDRYGCSYYNRSFPQAVRVRQLLKQLLGVTANMRQRSNEVWVVSCYNVSLAAWLSKKEQALSRIIAHRPIWQQQWLRALFDDEGHVHVNGGIRRVRASQDNDGVLQQAQQCLRTLGIESRIDQRAKAVEITGRTNLIAFQRCINFSYGIRVNANRKNGLQDSPLEKRDVLARALESYRTPHVL